MKFLPMNYFRLVSERLRQKQDAEMMEERVRREVLEMNCKHEADRERKRKRDIMAVIENQKVVTPSIFWNWFSFGVSVEFSR